MRRTIQYPATIRKLGGSFCIIVPKEYVDKAGWGVGQDVDVIITLPEEEGQEQD